MLFMRTGVLPAVLGVCAFVALAHAGDHRIDRVADPALVAGNSNDEIFANGFDFLQQTLTFVSNAPGAAQVAGSAYNVAATSSAGLPVALSVDPAAASVCSLNAASVTFQAAGTCVIDADQAGNSLYLPAPQAQQSFNVGKGDQFIAFTSSPDPAVVHGASYAVGATATSALAVSFSIDPSAAAVCSIAGTTVDFATAGTCVVNATQDGDGNWNAAALAQQSFAVGKGTQTIAFSSTPSGNEAVAGAAYVVTADSDSGLGVTLAVDPAAASICALDASGSGANATFQAAGTCTIDAYQGGDANWNSAIVQHQSFTVQRGTQTIAFSTTPPGSASVGTAAYSVAATATSGLPVALTIDASASGVCTLSAGSVAYIGAGTCVIDADQAGDGNWNAAPQMQQSFSVSSCVTLAVGQVLLDVMPTGAAVCVSNTDGANAEFTYMPINLDSADVHGLVLTASNIVAVTGPPSPIEPNGALGATPGDEAADDAPPEAPAMHLPETPQAARKVDASMLLQARIATAPTPLVVGQLLDINTTIGDCASATDVRKGRVEAITTAQSPGQPLLYAVQEVVESSPGQGDWHAAIAGGFATSDFQSMIDAFVTPPSTTAPSTTNGTTLGGLLKTGAMDVLTTDFGALTDLDDNGGVIVFFTSKINQLTPPASSSTVYATFQAHDLYANASCPASNQAEILYLPMPDPTGVVNSNVRTASSIYGQFGPNVVHHFAHLENAARRLYFNNGAPLEETWLDEGLAFEAQELVFFNASHGLGTGQNVIVTNLTTGSNASLRVADYNTYENPIFGAMRNYFFNLPGTNLGARFGPLNTQGRSVPGGDAHDQYWQSFALTAEFLRYAFDRNGSGDAVLIGALVNSNQTGMANLQSAIGVDPLEWARDFDIALYIDDTTVAVLPQYTTPSWSYRSLYTALNGSYQLTVDPLTDGAGLTFDLRYGGGVRYARFGVAPGQTANVSLTSGGAAPMSAIVTGLVRTK